MTENEIKVLDRMKRCWPRLAENITAGKALRDLGADSLDMVEFLTGLDESWGVRLETKDLDQVQTVGELCSHIAMKRQNKATKQ